MHCLKTKSKQEGTIVIGTGDFEPWRVVIDALHAKVEWLICIDPNMDERLLRLPKLQSKKEREIIGFGSGVGTHGEDNYTISTEQFSLSDIHFRLSSRMQTLFAEAEWSFSDCQDVAKGILSVSQELSGLSLVRTTGVDDQYIRDFMAFCLSRKMLKAKGSVICDDIISLDAYRHWFDLAENATRPDLMWLTAMVGDDKRLSLHVHLIECKMARQADELLIRARAQINNGLNVLMPAFAPILKSDDGNIEDNRPDRRYWWMQLHRLIASKTEIMRSQNLDVLSALERLADGDFDIKWDAGIFAFWITDNSANIHNIGHWDTGPFLDVSAHIYVIGSAFAKQIAIDQNRSPLNWESLGKAAFQANENICDSLNDIELPPGEDEDDDISGWDIEEIPMNADFNTNIQIMTELEGGTLFDLLNHLDAETAQLPLADDTLPASSAFPAALKTIEPLEIEIGADGAHDKIIPKEKTSPAELTEDGTLSVPKPTRILLGTTVVGQKPVYWEFGNQGLANRHMLIFGMSGMGKTYAIQCFLCELGRTGQNSLVIDYTDGFIPSKIEKAAHSFILDEGQEFIQLAPLPINPFKAQTSIEMGREFKDDPFTIAKRVTAIFRNVYDLGSHQSSLMIDAITEGLREPDNNFNLNMLMAKIQSYANDGEHPKTSVGTTISKIKSFTMSNPFTAERDEIGWDRIFKDEKIKNRVFQFHKVDKYSARALIEFILWDLYAFVSSHGNKDMPKVIVLDEIQNLDLEEDAPVAKYLTEGRKHGLALITATQTIRGVGGVSDARVGRLFQAELKLFFRPTEVEMREHAQLLHNAVSSTSVQDWITRLSSLQKGECWALGRFINPTNGKLASQALRIRISSLEERGFVE